MARRLALVSGICPETTASVRSGFWRERTNVRIVRGSEAQDLIESHSQPHDLTWLEGPHTADRLDVGVVSAKPGASTPPHVHLGGQVMVVLSGTGFVETSDGERVVMEQGDVVIAAPGEEHVHGAVEDSPVTHLTITTGRHEVGSSDA